MRNKCMVSLKRTLDSYKLLCSCVSNSLVQEKFKASRQQNIELDSFCAISNHTTSFMVQPYISYRPLVSELMCVCFMAIYVQLRCSALAL